MFTHVIVGTGFVHGGAVIDDQHVTQRPMVRIGEFFLDRFRNSSVKNFCVSNASKPVTVSVIPV